MPAMMGCIVEIEIVTKVWFGPKASAGPFLANGSFVCTAGFACLWERLSGWVGK